MNNNLNFNNFKEMSTDELLNNNGGDMIDDALFVGKAVADMFDPWTYLEMANEGRKLFRDTPSGGDTGSSSRNDAMWGQSGNSGGAA